MKIYDFKQPKQMTEPTLAEIVGYLQDVAEKELKKANVVNFKHLTVAKDNVLSVTDRNRSEDEFMEKTNDRNTPAIREQ